MIKEVPVSMSEITLSEKLEAIDKCLVELIAIADTIEAKIMGPLPMCGDTEGRCADHCIKTTVSMISEKIGSLHSTLLHINEKL